PAHPCPRPIHNVNVDYAAAGRTVALHLAEKGHRRIAFVGGKFEFLYQRESFDGFRAGLREVGIEYDQRLVVRKPLKQWLAELGAPPSAIVTSEPRSTSDLLR